MSVEWRRAGLLALCMFTRLFLHAQGYDEPRVINGVAVPADFPVFLPGINGKTAEGNIFISNWDGSPYITIFRNDGTPYYYKRVESRARDFKLQPTGMLSRRCIPDDCYIIMDRHFRDIDTVRCQNGYGTDEHGMQLLEKDGYAMMIALDPREIDLSELYEEGNPSASVIGNHVQIIDSLDRVIFEWNCFDHFGLEDSYEFDPRGNSIDYVHINSTAIDYDGNILISSRHLSECTKIDRQTGDIIWRLGGKNNMFTFGEGEDQNSYQHDFRPVPGSPGHYTMFDNGNQHEPQYSRAVEWYLDEVNMTATRIWEYRHIPDRYSKWMGNVQRLSNGNTFINWGNEPLPKATEVSPEGEIVYEADFEFNTSVYRSFRFEFDGYCLEPYLVVEPFVDLVRLIFNKFGDGQVDYYKIYAGTDPGQMEWIDSTRLTWINLSLLEDSTLYYLEVSAVGLDGVESPPSNREQVFFRSREPDDDLIRNGDFELASLYWNHVNQSGGDSEGMIISERYLFDITAGGSDYNSVQLVQPGIPMVEGEEYLLSLEARGIEPRTIEVKVGKDASPWTNYSKTGFIYITKEAGRFEFPFVMEDPTDLQSRLVINAGMSDINFYLDNVSLKPLAEPEGIESLFDEEMDFRAYPNPALGRVHVRFRLQGKSKVELTLITAGGRITRKLVDEELPAGDQRMDISLDGLSAGSYILELRYGNRVIYKKLMLL